MPLLGREAWDAQPPQLPARPAAPPSALAPETMTVEARPANAGGAVSSRPPSGLAWGRAAQRGKPETPLAAVARLRARLCRDAGGASSPVVVALLGSDRVRGDQAKEVFCLVAAQLASITKEKVCFISTGSPAEDEFARVCSGVEREGGEAATAWNLLTAEPPRGGEPVNHSAIAASVASGRVLRAGADADEVHRILLALGDIYICFGGCEAQRAEAWSLLERGAVLLPLEAAGSGDACPPLAQLKNRELGDDATWTLLVNDRARAKDVAPAVASIVAAQAAKLQALPAEDMLSVSGCSPSDLDGSYVRSGLRCGRKRFLHTEEPEQCIVFEEEGCWCLNVGGVRVYEKCSEALAPPASEWEHVGKPRPADGGNRRRTTASPGPRTAGSAFMGRRSSFALPMPPAMAPKPKAVSSISKTKGSRLAELIQRGCIALVKCSFLEDCLYNKSPLVPRQRMSSTQAWPGDEAVRKWAEHGKCFFVAVSYPWLSRTHPDPNSFHLRTLVGILGEYKRLWGMREVAVFIDYASMWQRDARSEDTRAQYAEALAEMATIYAHKAVTTIQLTSVPADEPREYEDRGWTLFESVMMSSKSGDWNRWAISGFDDDTPIDDPYIFFDALRPAVQLLPPMSPKRFEAELRARGRAVEDRGCVLFSDPRDSEAIHDRYREGLRHICAKAELSYCDAAWGDAEVLLLCEVLPDCGCLEGLVLSGNRIMSQGVSMLLKVLPKLSKLRLLVLTGNPLCRDAGDRDRLRVAWDLNAKPASGLVF